MSRVLPAELQTKKVKSLTGDAKKLVEDLLAEKFDIKEEVAPKKAKSFRGPDRHISDSGFSQSAWGANPFRDSGHGDVFEPDVGDRVRFRGRNGDIQTQVQPWNGLRIAEIEVGYPDERSIVDAFQTLDRQFGRGNQRKIYIGPGFFNELRRDERFSRRIEFNNNFRQEGVEQVVGQYYGFSVIVVRNFGNRCIVRDEF